MHIHYLSLEKIATGLHEKLAGSTFVEAFTQQKDEILLGFAHADSEMYVRVNCAPPLPYIWPMERFGKARKNVLLLLRELEGKIVLSVKAVEWERQILIELEGKQTLVLKMHGNQANLIWLNGKKVRFLFRSSLETDQDFRIEAGHFNQKTLEAGPGDLTLSEWLRTVSPTLDKNFLARIEQDIQTGLSPEKALENLLEEARDAQYYLIKEPTRLRFLLFKPANAGPNCTQIEGFDKALNIFLKSWYQFSAYSTIYTGSIKQLSAHLKKYRGRKESYEKSLFTLLDTRDPEEIGHLIMANLHLLKQGMEKAELQDLYTDQPITIKLRPELTPQKNAEIWYRKQKNRKSSYAKLEKELASVEITVTGLEAAWAKLMEFPTPESIELSESGFETQLLRDLQVWKKANEAIVGTGELPENAAKHPFKEYRKDDFLILAGRNAKNNDKLSFVYSNKDDLWFHAKDATGSHVIIRHDGREVPKHVREFAASIAAGLSERRTEGLVPVTCTPRKYIRKPRDGRPGQVLVDREEVILVEPFTPEKS